jgi:hypothetical protein
MRPAAGALGIEEPEGLDVDHDDRIPARLEEQPIPILARSDLRLLVALRRVPAAGREFAVSLRRAVSRQSRRR